MRTLLFPCCVQFDADLITSGTNLVQVKQAIEAINLELARFPNLHPQIMTVPAATEIVATRHSDDR